MRRRDVLRAAPVAALLSGCLTRTESASTPAPSVPEVSVEAVTPTPDLPGEFSMRVERPYATDAHPPVLEFVSRNPADAAVQVYYGYPENGGCPVFETSGDGPQLVLAADAIADRADVPDDCWQLPRGPWSLDLLPQNTYTLAPGETKVTPVGVYGKWTNPEGIGVEPGTYRFEEALTLEYPQSRPYQQRNHVEFDWSVTVHVSDPSRGK